MLIMFDVTILLRESMFSEFMAIPLLNEVTLSSIALMIYELVLRLIIVEVTILFRASMLFELVSMPFVKEFTLSFIAVIT